MKTSIAIAVYNREQYVAEAIESVLGQTDKEWELLIWDDGSTDRSVEIARYYESQDKRVQVIAASHQGVSISLHEVLKRATGDYVGWVDSDDKLAPTALSETKEILDTQPEVGMVYTDYLVIDEKGEVKGLGKRCQIPYSRERLLVDFMTFHFRLIRREVYLAVGGVDQSLAAAPDYDLCLRLSEVTQIRHLHKALYLYRHHKDNISHQRQLEQIDCTSLAINRALERRGLAEALELEVRIRPSFVLKRKKANKLSLN